MEDSLLSDRIDVAVAGSLGGIEMATKIKKWLYKACPHCIGGDLVYDEEEKAYQCIQCGYRKPRE